eukprot:GAHX01001574.1.p1 GENE.GAHX01001574.1~~GAHX01001574.1.p1  ORF type:complete len:318 (+),score=75.66 GAHX01001574.1:40-993(+)
MKKELERKLKNAYTKKIVAILNKTTENTLCFDCNAPRPNWSSVTFGVLICYNCSSNHRRLGVSITFCRSIDLDSWSDWKISRLIVGGNKNALEAITSTSSTKYTSKEAVQYKKALDQLCEKFDFPAWLQEHGIVTTQELERIYDEPLPTAKPVSVIKKVNLKKTSNNVKITAKSAKGVKRIGNITIKPKFVMEECSDSSEGEDKDDAREINIGELNIDNNEYKSNEKYFLDSVQNQEQQNNNGTVNRNKMVGVGNYATQDSDDESSRGDVNKKENYGMFGSGVGTDLTMDDVKEKAVQTKNYMAEKMNEYWTWFNSK